MVKYLKYELVKQVDSEIITASVLDARYKLLTFLSSNKDRKGWYKAALNTIQVEFRRNLKLIFKVN
jgi:hypothetical protein